MLEVEQKYRIEDLQDLQSKLDRLQPKTEAVQQHFDTYYNHPSRDFAETGEALRVRRIDGVPLITYKAPKLPGKIKARRELEWRLDPGDPGGDQMEELLKLLGFRRVAAVNKERRPYLMDGKSGEIVVVIDCVQNLGNFAEVELLVAGKPEIEPAREEIRELAEQLGLRVSEPRSYLQMVLQADSGGR